MYNQAFSKIWVSIILVIFIIGVILVWQYLLAQKEETIPLSILAEKIQEEQVEIITIRGNDIEAVLKNGTRLYLKKEVKTSLSEFFLTYGVSTNKLRNVMIVETGRGGFSTISALFLFLIPFGIYIIWFFIFYFLVLVGFKILKIEEVTISKIVVYIFVMFLVGFFLQPIISKSLLDTINIFTLYLINSIIFFGVTVAILKYYFSLSGKKLWLFFLYLIVLILIFWGLRILLS